MADTELNQLNDPELDQVVGGAGSTDDYSLYDSKGREIGGWICHHTRIGYWPCPKCKKPGHMGTFNYAYCDPCDYYWTLNATDWTGTEEQLIAAANSNL